jgi:hypothetical protein
VARQIDILFDRVSAPCRRSGTGVCRHCQIKALAGRWKFSVEEACPDSCGSQWHAQRIIERLNAAVVDPLADARWGPDW